MRYFQCLFVASAMCLFPRWAMAQGAADYPNKPVRVIVASATGGGTDISSRALTQKLSESLNRQFLVENRAGGGNTIGYAFVAQAPADGYTLLATTPSFTFTSALRPDLPYDPVRDFVPISLVLKTPYLLMVHPSLPVRSVRELIDLAKSKPGALDMAVSYGSFTHMAAGYFTSVAKIKVTLISYKGGNQDTIE